MKKWLNDLIVQLLLTVLFLAVFFPGCLIDIIVAGDALSTSSMTEPATKDDFEIMLVVYASMIAVTAGCGIWGKNLVANILAGTYGLLFFMAAVRQLDNLSPAFCFVGEPCRNIVQHGAFADVHLGCYWAGAVCEKVYQSSKRMKNTL